MIKHDEKHICVDGSLPDNYPWSDHFSEHHKHHHSYFHALLHGLSLEYPTNGAAVSGLIKDIRWFKKAITGMFSSPVVFSVDVEDGDLVRPISYQAVQDREVLELLVDLKDIPDAIWVPALKYPKDLSGTGKTLKDFLYTDSEPIFYGVAYKHINRVIVGPLVFHPKFNFRTGDKIFVAEGGKVTTEPSENLVGICISPGFLLLSQEASMLQAAMEEVTNILSSEIEDVNNALKKAKEALTKELEDTKKALEKAIETAKEDAIKEAAAEVKKGLESGDVSIDDVDITVSDRPTDRTLSEHFSDETNVKDFGAKGDGVTNDDAAFNKAVQYCLSLGDDACLFLPVGTYLLSKAPEVPCYGPGRIKVSSTIYKAFELLFTIHGGIKRDAKGRYYIDLQDMAAGGSGNQIFQNFIETLSQDLLPSPRNGGLELDKDKKLVIDLKNLTNAQRVALTKELILSDGGIVADSNGRLYVSFENMDDKKFEVILKTIRVPIWLTSSKTFYVNGSTGSDTLDDGRGESSTKPFKTVQACVNYVCNNYNTAKYVLTIMIAAGTYDESIALYTCQGNNAVILRGESRDSVIVRRILNYASSAWQIRDLTICSTQVTSSAHWHFLESVEGFGVGVVQVANICFDVSLLSNFEGKQIVLIGALSGVIRGISGQLTEELGIFIKLDPSVPIDAVLYVSGGSFVTAAHLRVTKSGEVGAFARSLRGGEIRFGQDSSPNPGESARVILESGVSVTGRRYSVTLNGVIDTGNRGSDFFPGTQSGSESSGGQYR